MPAPPYSSSARSPSSPSSLSLGTISSGKRSSSSHARAFGAISAAQKSRTVFTSVFCSSLSSKFIVSPLLLEALLRSARRVELDRLDRLVRRDLEGVSGAGRDVHGHERLDRVLRPVDGHLTRAVE